MTARPNRNGNFEFSENEYGQLIITVPVPSRKGGQKFLISERDGELRIAVDHGGFILRPGSANVLYLREDK